MEAVNKRQSEFDYPFAEMEELLSECGFRVAEHLRWLRLLELNAYKKEARNRPPGVYLRKGVGFTGSF